MAYASRLEHINDGVQEGIVATIDDLFYSGVDNEFRAGEAWRNRNVNRAARDGGSVIRGLADRVLLSVGAKALLKVGSAFHMAGAPRATAIEAILDAARRAVVASRKNMVVLHDDGADMTAAAVRALRHDLRGLHEIVVPARTRIIRLLCGHM